MKANVRRGGGFGGLLRYALDRGNQCAIVGGNMSGRTPRQLSSEFGISRAIRRDVVRPVWHCTLSLPANETLTVEQWDEVAHAHMRNVGLDPARHQFVVVLHTDTDHQHVHIIASRIGLDASLWHGVNDAFTAQASTQDLEVEFAGYGLSVTKGRDVDQEIPGAGPRAGLKISQNEMEMWSARGRSSPKNDIAEAVAEAIALGDGTPESLRHLLAEAGIEARISVGRGRVTGISYGMTAEWDGGQEAVYYKGIHIGGLCDAKSIERRLGERRAEIDRAAAAAAVVDDIKLETSLRAAPPDRLDWLAAITADFRKHNDAAIRSPERPDRTASLGSEGRDTDRPAPPTDMGGRRVAGSGAEPAEPGDDAPARGRGHGEGDPHNEGRGPESAGAARYSGRPVEIGADRPAAGGDVDRELPNAETPRGTRAETRPDPAGYRDPGPDRGREQARDNGLGQESDPAIDVEVEISVTIAWGSATRRRADPERERSRLHRLAEVYQRALGAQLDWIEVHSGHLEIGLRDGTRLTDTGDRINATWRGGRLSDTAIGAMISMAEAKGWHSVRLLGDDEQFKRDAWLACMRAGIKVGDYEPPAEVRAIWDAERQAKAPPIPEAPPVVDHRAEMEPGAGHTETAGWYAWQRLAGIYRSRLDPEVATHIAYVRSNRPSGPVEVGLRDTARLVDAGPRLSATWREGTSPAAAAAVMVSMAQAKGWKGIRVRSESEEFHRLAWLACQRAGLAVDGYEPPADLVAQWKAEKGSRAADGPDPRDAGAEPQPGADRHEQVRPGSGDPAAQRTAGNPDGAPGADRTRRGGQSRTPAPDDSADRQGADRRDADPAYPDFHIPSRRGSAGGSEQGAPGGGGRPAPGDNVAAAGDGGPARGPSRIPGDEYRRGTQRSDDAAEDRPDREPRTDKRATRRVRGPVDGSTRERPAGASLAWREKMERAKAAKRQERELVAGTRVADSGDASEKRPGRPADHGRAPAAGSGRAPSRNRPGLHLGDGVATPRRGQPELGSGVGAPNGKGEGPSQGTARSPIGANTTEKTPGPRPGLPYQKQYIQRGRDWLYKEHGIPTRIAAQAEKEGFIHYLQDAVGFTGRSEGKVVSVLRHPMNGRAPLFAEHSDEAQAPTILGDPNHVVLCAGGLAGLSRLVEADRKGEPRPTIIVLRPNSPLVGLGRLAPDLVALLERAERVDTYGFPPDPAFHRLLSQMRRRDEDDEENLTSTSDHDLPDSDPASGYDPTKKSG